MNRQYIILISNFFTFSGLSLLLLIYLPILFVYLIPNQPMPHLPENNQYQITIDSISVTSPIILKVDPWDKNKYLEALQQGVAHAAGSSLPGENGTIYLFAHSNDYPWNITRYNTAFYKLHMLNLGDQITITSQDSKYLYTVSDKKKVTPQMIEFLTKEQSADLILQTCTPIGTDWNRLLIFATQTEY